MSKFNYDTSLLDLTLSLTRSEKRYFKLYSNRGSSKKKDFLFIDLFDIIDRYESIDYKIIKRRLPSISPKQLSDLKRHLYKQLLECLSVYNSNNASFSLSSQINKAKVLYEKGLFINSLEILKSAKQEAIESQAHLKAYEIIAFEKEIESRHVTRSHSYRAQELEDETKRIREIIDSEAEWSEFSLKLYAIFIQKGYVNNALELEEISDYFNSQMPKTRDREEAYFFESLYKFQAFQWFNYIIQNFSAGYQYCKRWIDLFEKFPSFKHSHSLLYIKGLHNCLSVLFNCMDLKRHRFYLSQFEKFTKDQKSFDNNTRVMAFVYLNSARLNDIVLSGHFSAGKPYLLEFELQLNQLKHKIDDYRLMVFRYKMASIYFTVEDYSNAIRLLNQIINPNQKALREDLQCFARLLNIIAHFELGNDELLNSLVKSTYRFLLKMNEATELHKTLIRFLRGSLFKARKELRGDFITLKAELEILNEDPYERRSLLYLDIISWLESKIEDQAVEVIILNKREKLDVK